MKTTTTLLALSLFIPTCAIYAGDIQTRTHRADLTGIQAISFEGGVGEMNILRSTGDELLVELEIEGERNWLGRKRNIDDIDVVVSRRGDQLFVKVNEEDMDNLELNWHIELPTVSRTTINLGVGQLVAAIGDTELHVELGVGEARVEIPRRYIGRVDASVGVGSVDINGARDVASSRAFVSETVHGYGDGSREARMQVGVGEISIVFDES